MGYLGTKDKLTVGESQACHRCCSQFQIHYNQILTRNYLIQVLWIKKWSAKFVNT